METLTKIAALAVTGSLLALTLRTREGTFALLLGLGVLALMGALSLELMKPVLDFVRSLGERAALSGAVVGPVLRTLAVGLITDLGAGICRDAGESAVAGALETAGTLAAVYLLLPLMESLLGLVEGLL